MASRRAKTLEENLNNVLEDLVPAELPMRRAPKCKDTRETQWWRREVIPVLKRLKPYRLRKPFPKLCWFEIHGLAPKGKVRIDIAGPDPAEDSDFTAKLISKGYANMEIAWRIVPLSKLEAEVEEVLGSRPDIRLLPSNNQVTRIDLAVPYAEKDEAKALGARWDAEDRVWWVISTDYCDQMTRWARSSSE